MVSENNTEAAQGGIDGEYEGEQPDINAVIIAESIAMLADSLGAIAQAINALADTQRIPEEPTIGQTLD